MEVEGNTTCTKDTSTKMDAPFENRIKLKIRTIIMGILGIEPSSLKHIGLGGINEGVEL